LKVSELLDDVVGVDMFWFGAEADAIFFNYEKIHPCLHLAGGTLHFSHESFQGGFEPFFDSLPHPGNSKGGCAEAGFFHTGSLDAGDYVFCLLMIATMPIMRTLQAIVPKKNSKNVILMQVLLVMLRTSRVADTRSPANQIKMSVAVAFVFVVSFMALHSFLQVSFDFPFWKFLQPVVGCLGEKLADFPENLDAFVHEVFEKSLHGFYASASGGAQYSGLQHFLIPFETKVDFSGIPEEVPFEHVVD
jgi:hypothetical protein